MQFVNARIQRKHSITGKIKSRAGRPGQIIRLTRHSKGRETRSNVKIRSVCGVRILNADPGFDEQSWRGAS